MISFEWSHVRLSETSDSTGVSDISLRNPLGPVAVRGTEQQVRRAASAIGPFAMDDLRCDQGISR